MYWLTQQSVKRASVTLLIAVALVAGGVYSALNISQELTPDIDFPLVTVITVRPGASPQDVADSVSAPLEAEISNVAGLQTLQSISAESVSILVAQFEFGDDMKAAEEEIRRNVANANVPADAGQPNVTRLNINQILPVIHLTVGGDLPTAELEAIARRDLVTPIRALDGVQSVDVIGGVTRQIDVELDLTKMGELGITSQQVTGVLRANNVSIPSGQVRVDGRALPFRTVTQLTSLDDIRSLIVGFARAEGQQPRPAALGEIASVEIAPSPVATISRTNGKPSVGLAVTKTQGANSVSLASAVKDLAKLAQAKAGSDVEIVTVLDQSRLIEESIAGLTREGLIGAAAAVLAIWLFLLSFRSTLAAAVSIPLSLLVAVLVLFFQGFTLNILTLGGLTIALGRVVDDSIVVLENIFRHVQEGEALGPAVLNGTREVSGAIVGATLTTIAVFVPLVFAGGFTSVLFQPFGLTVSVALLASLLVALTLVPVLARFLIPRARSGGRAGAQIRSTWLQRLYTPVLAWSLRHRVWTLAIAAVVFVGSLALVPLIPTTFLPSGGERQFTASVSLPPGSGTAQELQAKALEAEQVLAGLPDVEVYNTNISLGTGSQNALALGRAIQGQGTRGATFLVRVTAGADLEVVKELARERLATIDGVLTRIAGGGSDDANANLQITVRGDDRETVGATAVQVAALVREVEGLRDISTAAGVRRPELAVRVDPAAALGVGLSGAELALQLRELAVGQTATQVRLDGGASLDVVVRADPSYFSDLEALRRLPVGTVRTVPLSSIARIEQTLAPTQVTRTDQRPSATITGTITAANTGEVNQAIQERIDRLVLPQGVEVTLGGALRQFSESFNTLFVGIGAAAIAVYIVMVLVMGSVLSPFVIMFSLPLASIGALAALAITGRALGLPALFGFLMLVGIVVTNGIVLVDFVNQLRARGLSVHAALIEGGRLRVRPVLMTAVTTILALIPLSLGFTEGAIIAADLAVVVMGGLISSTVLTLVVVPVVYSIVHGIRARPPETPVPGSEAG